MIYDNILATIGRTPVVRINRLGPKHVTMYVKVEFFNPGASVKDRLAIGIIEDAERRGLLKPGQTVVEATSGNTGIALALVCAAKGYPFVAVMAESFSIERRKIMRGMGAKVILTPAAERGSGMVRKAKELSEKHGWFLARQFENEANPAYHRQTTGPEILLDFAGKRLDYFVSGWGTGGTITGAGQVLKKARPSSARPAPVRRRASGVRIDFTSPCWSPSAINAPQPSSTSSSQADQNVTSGRRRHSRSSACTLSGGPSACMLRRCSSNKTWMTGRERSSSSMCIGVAAG